MRRNRSGDRRAALLIGCLIFLWVGNSRASEDEIIQQFSNITIPVYGEYWAWFPVASSNKLISTKTDSLNGRLHWTNESWKPVAYIGVVYHSVPPRGAKKDSTARKDTTAIQGTVSTKDTLTKAIHDTTWRYSIGIYRSILTPQMDEYFTIYDAFGGEHGFFAEILATTKVQAIWFFEFRLDFPKIKGPKLRPFLSLGLKDINFQSTITGTRNFYTDSLITVAPDTVRSKGPAVPFDLHPSQDFTAFEVGIGATMDTWTKKVPFPLDTRAGLKVMWVKGTKPSFLAFLSFTPRPS